MDFSSVQKQQKFLPPNTFSGLKIPVGCVPQLYRTWEPIKAIWSPPTFRTGCLFIWEKLPNLSLNRELESLERKGKEEENGMEVWSHNLQTVVAPMAVSRLGSCLQRLLQWHIIEEWQILKKKNLKALRIFFIRWTFHPYTNSKNFATKHVFWA